MGHGGDDQGTLTACCAGSSVPRVCLLGVPGLWILGVYSLERKAGGGVFDRLVRRQDQNGEKTCGMIA